jgi:hypothetical protein
MALDGSSMHLCSESGEGLSLKLLSNRLKGTPSTYDSPVRVDTTSASPTRRLRPRFMELMEQQKDGGKSVHHVTAANTISK